MSQRKRWRRAGARCAAVLRVLLALSLVAGPSAGSGDVLAAVVRPVVAAGITAAALASGVLAALSTSTAAIAQPAPTGPPAAESSQVGRARRGVPTRYLAPLPLQDVGADAARSHQLLARTRHGYAYVLFDKTTPTTADVQLARAASGASLRFVVQGQAVTRVAAANVATATFADGMVVRWSSFADRLKEDILLPRRPANDRIVFSLSYQGLRLDPDGVGGFVARSSNDGAKLFRMLPPTLEDAQGREGDATLTLQGESATITLDAAFLATATYPLTVDPTTTLLSPQAIRLNEPGDIYATFQTQNGDTCWRTFGLDSPERIDVFGSTETLPEGARERVGDHSWQPGQELVFYQDLLGNMSGGPDLVPCRSEEFLSTDTSAAIVTPVADDEYQIAWESFPPPDLTYPEPDYNDMIVRIQAVPAGSGEPTAVDPFWFRTHQNRWLPVGRSADPVNLLNGSFEYTRTDLAIAGKAGGVSLTHAHNRNDERVGPLGPGWTLAHGARIVRPDATSADRVLVTPEGRSDRYTYNVDGTYTPPQAVYTTLVKNADGTYAATHQDQSRWQSGHHCSPRYRCAQLPHTYTVSPLGRAAGSGGSGAA